MIPFREKGVPAVLQIEDKTGDFNPQYHRQGDSMANMSLGYWESHIRALTAAAAVLAQPVSAALPSPPATATHSGPLPSVTAQLTEAPSASPTPSVTQELPTPLASTAVPSPSVTPQPTEVLPPSTKTATPSEARLPLPLLLKP